MDPAEVHGPLSIRLEFGSNVHQSKGYPMKPPLRIPLLLACLTGFILAGTAARSLAADKVIKIGALLPISGPGSYFGVQDKRELNSHSTSSKVASTVTSLRFSTKIPRAAPCRRRKQPNACLINISPTW